MNNDTWKHVRFVTGWLDKESAPAEDQQLLRILKISEEVGEVTAAVIGATGQNPRKGITHTWNDVRTELCDVILAAMVALDSISDEAEEVFANHVQQRHNRILDLNSPRCSCCGERSEMSFRELPKEWWCGSCVNRCEPGGDE